MRPGVRTKLFTASLSLMVVVGGLCAAYLEWSLRGFLEERVEVQLTEHARTVRESLTLLRSSTSSPALDELVGRLAATTQTRITVIDGDGLVLADSDVPFAELDRLDNHGTRPEVIQAVAEGLGLARRYSDTIETSMLYVAVAHRGGAVRAATPLAIVDHVIHQLRLLLAVAALLGLGLAVVMSLLASHFLSRALRQLVDHARVLVSGQGHRIDILSTDEIGHLAGSFNQLAEELEGTLAALATERARFEAILDSMGEGVLVVDEVGRVILVNPETMRLLHLPEPPMGLPIEDTVCPLELRELVRAAAQGRAEAEFVVPGERPLSVLARATPFRDSGGAVVVMHDVTDVRRLENIRKDFVANVSHELRTPVSIVQANAETLLDGALADPKRARTFVEALHRNAERLSRIIADLLDLSRLEAGRYRFEMATVDVAESIEHAVEAVNARARSRDQQIEISVPDSQEVRADPKALEQVLLNLLENAIKYTPDGGHIAVRAEELGEQVRIEVQDDGPGIKPEHRARIFERFYRIDPGRSRDMGGTGLGLAIVKHFAESMRGRVGVEPAFPRGSIFWLTLPVAQPAEAVETDTVLREAVGRS
ncbi:MAG: ATP-binding protein [Myxococcota bacterium]